MEETGNRTQSTDLSEQLQSVLSDPARMKQIMQMASALAGSGGLQGMAQENGGAEHPSADVQETRPPAVQEEELHEPQKPQEPREQRPGGTGARSSVGGRHTALLHALRPYMSTARQKRIDQVLKMLRLAELADTAMKLQP